MAAPDPAAPARSFVSNSTNFEDVLLHRLFSRQGGGFFVDVGAGHPRYDNDTHALYEAGWRGINVEPSKAFFALLEQERPRDRNLCVLLSDAPSPGLEYHEIPGTGLSTCDVTQAAAHVAAGLEVQTRTVPVTTLAEVLRAADPPAIDFLKVDVEGFEERVLSGNAWDRFRPRLVLTEATFPNSPDRRPTGIRQMLGAHGYRHVHFDGLNDWYAEAGFDPGTAFVLSPNVFDGFVRREVVDLQERLAAQAIEAEATAKTCDSLRAEFDRLAKSFAEAETYAHSLEAERVAEAERAAILVTERDALQATLAARVAEVRASEAERAAILVTERDALRAALAARTGEARAAEAVATTLLDGSDLGAPGPHRRGSDRGRLEATRSIEGEFDPGVEPVAADEEAVRVRQDTISAAEGHMQDEDEVDSGLEALTGRLLAAQQTGLAAENRRLGHRIDDLSQESRRLRAANAELRREILELNRALERTSYSGQEAEFDDLRRDLRVAHLEARDVMRLLEAHRQSTSWKLTRPLRALGRMLGRGG